MFLLRRTEQCSSTSFSGFRCCSRRCPSCGDWTAPRGTEAPPPWNRLHAETEIAILSTGKGFILNGSFLLLFQNYPVPMSPRCNCDFREFHTFCETINSLIIYHLKHKCWCAHKCTSVSKQTHFVMQIHFVLQIITIHCTLHVWQISIVERDRKGAELPKRLEEGYSG